MNFKSTKIKLIISLVIVFVSVMSFALFSQVCFGSICQSNLFMNNLQKIILGILVGALFYVIYSLFQKK
ncbi:hypothetical protein COU58_01310 [Candidatus Pacearchaeota archaeon CG10_big_fil_rev_8_21_14_0_10_32_42]|nr:MAG: hypothetical protein COU58_01310 [Candidatus Pacearchaeota archaeon CG10_big_fil_rev_8_21_14_0_10_32_42]